MAVSNQTAAAGDSLQNSGISLERRQVGRAENDAPFNRRGLLGSLLAFWRYHHQEITSIAVLAGLLATFLQLRASTQQFDQQMEQNRRATATLLVSEFFNQVGDIVLNGSEDETARSQLDKVVASRANLLFEELEFTEPRAQILRFLASSDYGRLVGKKPFDSAPSISLKNITLTGSNLSGTDFRQANIQCALLGGSRIGDADLSDADIAWTDLSGTTLGNARFINTRLHGVDLRHSIIAGKAQFLGADILQSDLTGMQVTDAIVRQLNSAMRMRDAANAYARGEVVGNEAGALAFLLADANSLQGSRLDPAVMVALQHELAARGEADRLAVLLGDRTGESFIKSTVNDNATLCGNADSRPVRTAGESSPKIVALSSG